MLMGNGTSIDNLVDFENKDFFYTEIDAHINDQCFTDTALEIFDEWQSHGIITA